jgi:hypothetical protein
MSSIVKTNNFTTALRNAIRENPKFKVGRNYADLMIWSRLCIRLSDSDIFSILPIALRTIWSDEEMQTLLKARATHPADRFNVQSLAANLVCFRRSDIQDGELHILQQQLAHLSNEFNNLSGNVFDILKRLDRLEEENTTLKQALLTHGLIKDPVIASDKDDQFMSTTGLSIRSDQDAVTKYVL